jgi:hypothetical protein
MSGITTNKVIRTAIFALSLLASAACFAHGGGGGGWHGGGGGWHGGGGGWHGGGGGWHGGGGGWHGGGGYYHHGGGYYHHGGGYYHGGYYGGWGTGVVIGVPFGGYYPPACQTIRVCNNYGHCWYQDSCY